MTTICFILIYFGAFVLGFIACFAVNVRITETLEKMIRVDAETKEEAIAKVESMWKSANDSCILTADDFGDVEFSTEETQEPAIGHCFDDAYVKALRNEWNEVIA